MRILQICNKAPYPANDGSSIAICSLAEGLADCGVELHLLAVNTKKHFKPDEQVPQVFKQKTHYRSVYQDTDPTAFGAFLNMFSSRSYFVSRFYFKAYEKALIEKLSSGTFDVVQVEGVFMASYIPVVRRYSKAKIALRTHNVEHQIWERHLRQEKNSFKKFYIQLQNKRLKRFEIEAFHAVDTIVPITEIDQRQIEALVGKKPVFTCLTGVDLDKYQKTNKVTYQNTAFHFASMDWLPNVEAVEWLMRDVWPIVQSVNREIKLVLAGRNMPDVFKRLQNENIEVMESVADSAQFYKAYEIMLVPLWSGSGLRIKLVEGLAYGKAIVTTSIGAEGIPYEHNKQLIIADNAQAFAEAIISLAADEHKKQELGQQARILAETHFDYKVLAGQLIEFYQLKQR